MLDPVVSPAKPEAKEMPDLKLRPREFPEESCIDNCPKKNMGTFSASGVVNTDNNYQRVSGR